MLFLSSRETGALRRVLLALAISGLGEGCGPARLPVAAPMPPPPAPPHPMPLVEGPSVAPPIEVSLCLLVDGDIARVAAQVDPGTGDTTIAGQPWKEAEVVRTAPYAAAKEWFVRGEMMPVPGRREPLEMYGLARVLPPGWLRRFGEYRGVPLFVEDGWKGTVPDVVYLFARPGCEFQPYQQAYAVGAVRG
jgi:hypothetical protein